MKYSGMRGLARRFEKIYKEKSIQDAYEVFLENPLVVGYLPPPIIFGAWSDFISNLGDFPGNAFLKTALSRKVFSILQNKTPYEARRYADCLESLMDAKEALEAVSERERENFDFWKFWKTDVFNVRDLNPEKD